MPADFGRMPPISELVVLGTDDDLSQPARCSSAIQTPVGRCSLGLAFVGLANGGQFLGVEET